MENNSLLTEKSKVLFQKAEKFLPGGVNGNIKFRDPYPLFLSRANGSHIWDVDGNEYVDYILAYGALILGHGHPAIVKAIKDVIDSYGTILFGNPTTLEVEFAELLLKIFKKEGKLRFTNSGMEATLLATRLAMASTKKRNIAKFDGHYHGANPFLLANYRPKKRNYRSEQIEKEPDSSEIVGDLIQNIVVLPFNNIEGTKKILENEEVSSVILEPFEDGYIPAKQDFMYFLRKYTKDNGILLIFDEVKTGFRVRLGGAVEYYGIQPDIICLGKIIGGGAPIGAVIGDTDIMDLLDPRTKEENRVFHSGTFNGNPLSMALGIATVNELMSGNNFAYLSNIAGMLKKEISNILDEFGISHRMYGEGGIVNFILSEKEINTYRDISEESMRKRKIIDSGLIKHGIYIVPGSRFSLSTVHSESDIDVTVNALKQVLKYSIEKGTLK